MHSKIRREILKELTEVINGLYASALAATRKSLVKTT